MSKFIGRKKVSAGANEKSIDASLESFSSTSPTVDDFKVLRALLTEGCEHSNPCAARAAKLWSAGLGALAMATVEKNAGVEVKSHAFQLFSQGADAWAQFLAESAKSAAQSIQGDRTNLKEQRRLLAGVVGLCDGVREVIDGNEHGFKRLEENLICIQAELSRFDHEVAS